MLCVYTYRKLSDILKTLYLYFDYLFNSLINMYLHYLYSLSVTEKQTSQMIFLACSFFTLPYGHSMISCYLSSIEAMGGVIITPVFLAFPYNSIYLLQVIYF